MSYICGSEKLKMLIYNSRKDVIGLQRNWARHILDNGACQGIFILLFTSELNQACHPYRAVWVGLYTIGKKVKNENNFEERSDIVYFIVVLNLELCLAKYQIKSEQWCFQWISNEIVRKYHVNTVCFHPPFIKMPLDSSLLTDFTLP